MLVSVSRSAENHHDCCCTPFNSIVRNLQVEIADILDLSAAAPNQGRAQTECVQLCLVASAQLMAVAWQYVDAS
jgi:hypothetical protein